MKGDIKKIFRFRYFPVYVDSRRFVFELKNITKNAFPKDELFGLRSQLWRALDSILLNIAEGANRGTDKDFARFLNISCTSLNEVVACIDIALDNSYISNEQHTVWLERAGALSQQLTAFRRHLVSSSNVKGQLSNVKRGFTLVETLIYVAIIGAVVVTFLNFGLSVTDSRNKTYVTQEVQANIRTAEDTITRHIRAATGVNTSTSVFGSDPGVLSLSMASSTLDPTIIALNADNGILEVRQGASASTTITTERVSVTNLVFTNLTASSTRENIRINMTMEYTNPSGDVYIDFSQSITSSVSLRQ